MTRQPDVLLTPRLSLRRPVPADAAAVLRILSDPAVARHHPSELVTELDEVEALVGRWREHWEHHGFGNCCVVEESTGLLVGNAGVRWTSTGGGRGLNLMYRFSPSTWGRGYATEAADGLLGWVRASLPDELVVARIRPTNLSSQRVATKVGLRRDPDHDAQGDDGVEWAFTNRT
ncbi:GNAT family N-acetyltransferase [Terrabacter sp. NPDC000476]|uniref:GNAT family N-acetyltransferase n=1 Tax=Terrabacter sp. NPDC000476 TaxID=3154258 RepID=UPI00331891DB